MRLISLLASASMATLAAAPAFAEGWLVLSGASYHFRQEERDWREFNPGIGVELSTSIPDVYQVVGYFKNSYDRHALHAGVRWMPLKWGPMRFGGYALAATGYPSPVLVLPGFSIESEKVGVNVVVAPNVREYSGYVGVQMRVRME